MVRGALQVGLRMSVDAAWKGRERVGLRGVVLWVGDESAVALRVRLRGCRESRGI